MVLFFLRESSARPLLFRILGLTTALLLSVCVTVLFPERYYASLQISRSYKSVRASSSSVNPDYDEPCPSEADKKPIPIYPNIAFSNCTLIQSEDEPLMDIGTVKASPFVIESHKLLLFTVRKVASREFTLLARRMMGLPAWNKSCRWSDVGLTWLYDYSPLEAESMVLSEEWTRSIFVRDPKERILSAYLNKIKEPRFMHEMCCRKTATLEINNLLQCDNRNVKKLNVSFAEFVEHVVPSCHNHHWIPQAHLLRPEEWKTINFVGNFDTLEQDGRRLLETIGAWQEFGATGWAHGSLFHRGGISSKTTGANDKLRQFYTPELEERVENFYRDDYDLQVLNLPRYKIFVDEESGR